MQLLSWNARLQPEGRYVPLLGWTPMVPFRPCFCLLALLVCRWFTYLLPLSTPVLSRSCHITMQFCKADLAEAQEARNATAAKLGAAETGLADAQEAKAAAMAKLGAVQEQLDLQQQVGCAWRGGDGDTEGAVPAACALHEATGGAGSIVLGLMGPAGPPPSAVLLPCVQQHRPAPRPSRQALTWPTPTAQSRSSSAAW